MFLDEMPKKYFNQFIAEMVDALNQYADLIQKHEPEREGSIIILRKAAELIPETRDEFYYVDLKKERENNIINSEKETPEFKYPAFVTKIPKKT